MFDELIVSLYIGMPQESSLTFQGYYWSAFIRSLRKLIELKSHNIYGFGLTYFLVINTLCQTFKLHISFLWKRATLDMAVQRFTSNRWFWPIWTWGFTMNDKAKQRLYSQTVYHFAKCLSHLWSLVFGSSLNKRKKQVFPFF